MSHLFEAKALKEEFPKETERFTLFEVERIWAEYSETLAAGWLIPIKYDVERVFAI